MPAPDDDALPADVEAFFEAERARPPLTPEAVRALREATEAALTTSTPAAKPRPTGGPLGGAAMGLLVGVVLGAAGAIALHPAPPTTVHPDLAPRALPAAAAAPAARPAATPVAPPVAPPAVAPVAAPRAPGVPHSDALAREQLLLQRCRSALLRGDGAAALEAVQLHARQFRAGVLVEEREALRIEALAHLRRIDEARARAADFHRRWPGSLFGDLVDRATADAMPGGT